MALSPETRAVIDAVLEALDIPYAATIGGEQVREAILRERLMATVVRLRSLAKRDDAEWLTRDLDDLRERLAERPPVGYVTHDQAHARVAAGASWAEAVRPPAEVA